MFKSKTSKLDSIKILSTVMVVLTLITNLVESAISDKKTEQLRNEIKKEILNELRKGDN